jgi:predicted DNA-binding protein
MHSVLQYASFGNTIIDMTTITCKVPEEMAAQLDSLARAERRSKSDLVREALEEKLKGKHKSRGLTGYDLAKHLCGVLKGGPSDLATNPEHMKGFGE